MGGGHHEPYKVPDASIYKVEEIPQLKQVKDALARQGLKDPWLRNEVWRYNPKEFGTHRQRAIKFFLRGLPLGIGLCALTLGVEFAMSKAKGDDHGHGGHGGHGGH